MNAVRDLLPRELDNALGDHLPPNVSAAIITAPAAGLPRERSPQQLVKAVEHVLGLPLFSAWKTERDAGRAPLPPYGPLVSMLKDTAECGNLGCDAIRQKTRRGRARSRPA
ncbi:hypothetical protein AQF52_0088 [Streptomyces venezuelae]|uniref:hypothetical protein n=1 Tax=Streptomyces gardneri TaxID=66892 RepID=UPI0006BCBE53|nr:hypothetical protein [Streptomyces gardneri]ALO05690.1 hypothetical protein AQF52_0088 [Streptomyces venezuelae]QPK43274.1 hypothetical protein H4W23_00445 [Streptomyces gardneri]WRK34492.1 hypothetical protein U0M97_00430 [Streptomyces venezuelae]CUM44130.1 hypothetical protein BN2537_17225 [Streptomyces venezuelae]